MISYTVCIEYKEWLEVFSAQIMKWLQIGSYNSEERRGSYVARACERRHKREGGP